MNLSTKKLGAIAATFLLSMVGVGAISTPANAADCPYPVENPTSNDNPTKIIRLISPVLTDENSIKRYDFESQFTIDCDWFGVGMHFNQVYVPFGLRTSLTYHASTPSGVPLANTEVTLRANKGYSNSNANVKVNGVTARPAPSNASDGANVRAMTDANGNVTFVVNSPSDCEAYGGTLPLAPANFTSDTPNDRNGDPTTDCYSQFLPSISGEKTDAADFLELHFFDSSALDYTATDATLSLLAPQLTEANSIQNGGLFQAYSPVGSKQILAFHATKDDGSYARNMPVTVRINLANSGANAKVSAGIIGNTANGASTTLTSADSTKTTEDQLVLSGTTDSFGTVTFTVNNTDTTGGPTPASMTSPVPTAGAKFAKITAGITGFMPSASEVEFHYYKPVVVLPTTITATASGRKITIVINNATGKTSTVSITGKAKVTLKPTTSKKVLTYTVNKGKITVKVVANGKTLTKIFTIK